MVYLREIIDNHYYLIDQNLLESFWYYYNTNPTKLKQIQKSELTDSEYYSLAGYSGTVTTKEEQRILDELICRPPVKGIDISANIFRFLGIYLLRKESLYFRLKDKYEHSNLKYKFVIAEVENNFKKNLILSLQQKENSDDNYNILINYIYGIRKDNFETSLVSFIRRDAFDLIDIYILEKIEEQLLLQYTKTNYINYSPYELIKLILNNFSNSVRKITKDRRKDHSLFEINDEYDIQDIMYVILKTIFPDLKIEEPTPSVGATFSKIDLILEREGILIEAKMIKEKDTDEKKFINELKIDIQSYYKKEKFKHLICFVYDPYNKTKDLNHFYELNGSKEIKDVKFDVEVIVQK